MTPVGIPTLSRQALLLLAATFTIIGHARAESVEPPGLEGTLAAHNDIRGGLGIEPLAWDAALAATAQAWADQCVDLAAPFGFIDTNPDRSDGYPWYVGENAYGSAGSASGVNAVALWAGEVQNYEYDTNTCSAICGHYTQIVWAATEFVGCGISSCPGLTFGNSVVCNYGPGGNTGGRPYEVPEPSSWPRAAGMIAALAAVWRRHRAAAPPVD
jgi:uncharacterized protein YkwD